MTGIDRSSRHAAPGRWRRWRRRLSRWATRVEFFPRMELVAAALTVVLGWSSYVWLTGRALPANGASPATVTLLLVANLVPVMLLVVLIARRIAILLAARRRGTAGSQLHIRLVALFAGIAAVPTVLVVIFASLLFQFGVQFWFSDRVGTILGSANQVAQAYVDENRVRVAEDIPAMATDVRGYAREFGLGSDLFGRGLAFQVAARNLSEAAVFTAGGDGRLTTVAAAGLNPSRLAEQIRKEDLARARSSAATLVAKGSDRVAALVSLDDSGHYLYIARKLDPAVLARADRAASALGDYQALRERSRVMQLRFNLVLLAMSALTLAVAVWFALWLANRLVTPISRLAMAAERVGAGDLEARVPVRGSPDEIGKLARTFNRMTSQLKAQQADLLAANQQSDLRRRFTETVLSGVSAGVMSIAPEGSIRVVNRSAVALLGLAEHALVGQRLDAAVPELAALLEQARHDGDASGQVVIVRGAETQTLSVRISGDPASGIGYVLTFDDISAQLADQRRAAWADVARRIAHEIKNPLTPIQLAAERLQRKYGGQVTDDADTFATLTGTIVRQVADLRRMVDEFSEFARLPKPVFAPESIERIARQVLVLQEVAFPTIRFALQGQTSGTLMCDRHQIGRVLTNLIKNAAESVTARIDREAADGLLAREGLIDIIIGDDATGVMVTITDNGVGLPADGRERLTEPYVTTRARGTGLGLAIVKKIVEDHGGSLLLGDAPGGGAMVTIRLSRSVPGIDVEPQQAQVTA